jgi:glycosyltransferase involved in cell wall biosynthesis
MKVSIITAALNGEGCIARTLDSVAQQDYPDIEHVVADGGSTDRTLDIVRASDVRAPRVLSSADSGVYAAFNKGLRAATGDVIAYLNCGDCYETSSAVSKAVRSLTTHGVEAVFADLLIVDPNRRSKVIRRFSSRRFSPSAMTFGLMPAHPTLFLRRAVYEAVGYYDPEFRIAGDYEFCLRAFVKRATSYRYIPEALVRMPSGGVSNRGWRSKLAITDEMLRACRMNGVVTSRARLSLRFPLKIAELI